MNYVRPRVSEGLRVIPVRLFVRNDGKKTARDASVILFIPEEFRPAQLSGQRYNNPEDWYSALGIQFVKNEEVEGARRDHVRFSIPWPVFPGEPIFVKELNLFVPGSVLLTSNLFWRIVCDDGATPRDKPYESLEFTLLE
jgi:hypothetical protein